ncbi:hypothetical protein GN277_12775 [Lachnospiraceae bacterium WCA-9-b2]|jgi:hypothetical protein|uniref:XRE family transcriptional regulator n=1 Tax=Sporofaciens musculi TaxID=2681861 RepID=A0A7X3MHA0_9FIRM|nr:hypothetical protein [Sporofaciens musculi]MXP76235.1 hypothetical protein [Sporofaciens musculi]
METLSQVVQKYLEANGIEDRFFADFIGCGRTKCSLWFKGKKRLTPEQLRKTHEFLAGKHLKSLDEIMK